MLKFLNKNHRFLLLFLCLAGSWLTTLHAQESPPPDTARVLITGKMPMDSIRTDTMKIVEDNALDIAQNRGLFILTPDRKVQLRILGSVRFLAVVDNRDMTSKNGFKSIEIPVGQNDRDQPNYYNGLDQTRLGFEVTRATEMGNIFVRLETDFAGPNGYRIRHAYGQFRRFLFGQTWSLFSQITTLPATVDFSGPTGAITVRTPQIRYSFQFKRNYTISVGLEYSKTEENLPDSLQVKVFQLIPDVTARIQKNTDWGILQLSGIMPVLTGSTPNDKFIVKYGWGISFSTMLNSWLQGKWYIQGAGGRAISRFFNDFAGQGLDIVIDPETLNEQLPLTFGGYIAYEHQWKENLYSNISYGIQLIEKYSLFAPESFHRGQTFHLTTFWTIIEGARMGIEFIYGQRYNLDKSHGSASRINMLFYYDF